MITLYFLLRFIICDAFNLYTNIALGSICKSLKEAECENIFWNYASVINLQGNPQMLYLQDILNLVIIVLSLIFFFIYRKIQYELNKEIDKNHQTEDDFTLFISGIPLLDFPSNQELKKMKTTQSIELYHRYHLWTFL